MPDDPTRPASTTDYSASQAPETQKSAEHDREEDLRAIPGGSRERSTASVGMESMEKDENS